MGQAYICTIQKKPVNYSFTGFAEKMRFELTVPFWGTHAFQACLFNHSSTSPWLKAGAKVGIYSDCNNS
jgi:hypothetical protein